MPWRVRVPLAFLERAPGFCGALGASVLPLIRRHPVLLSHVIAAHAAPQERERLVAPDERRAAGRSFLDASAGGVRGMIDDYLTYSRGWGFPISEVGARVHLWHGVNDPLVPIEHALALAATLPDCRLFFDADEGHHFFRLRLREILGALIATDDRSAELITSVRSGGSIAPVRPYGSEQPGGQGGEVLGLTPRRAATADAERVGRRLRTAA
jgi:pimeloyl-ACP methyl ester carboxylesterase